MSPHVYVMTNTAWTIKVLGGFAIAWVIRAAVAALVRSICRRIVRNRYRRRYR